MFAVEAGTRTIRLRELTGRASPVARREPGGVAGDPPREDPAVGHDGAGKQQRLLDLRAGADRRAGADQERTGQRGAGTDLAPGAEENPAVDLDVVGYAEPAGNLTVADLTLNLLTREVKRGDQDIELTAREFALLERLMRSPGRVFTRAQISEQVWNYQFDPGTNIVDVYIKRLRKKIDAEADVKLIETIRGVGYRMKAAT